VSPLKYQSKMRSLFQNPPDISLSVENGDDLQRARLCKVNDLVGSDRPKKNWLSREIPTPVPHPWHRRQTTEGIVNFSANALRSINAVLCDIFVDFSKVLGGFS
jgi:hypothetical protein